MYKILDGKSKYFDNKKLKFKPTAQNFCIPLVAVRVITKTLPNPNRCYLDKLTTYCESKLLLSCLKKY